MAIYGIGATRNNRKKDVSSEFIQNNIAGPAWTDDKAPELRQFICSLKVGDIIYIKSSSPSSRDIIVKGIGLVGNEHINKDHPHLAPYGRNIIWIDTAPFRIPKPTEKYNVRLNTMYEEFHPDVQAEILKKITAKFQVK